ADKIDRLNEHGTFPGIEQMLPVVADATSFTGYLQDWEIVLFEPDQITTNVAKFESLLRSEYDAAAEKGRAVYAPERVTTPGPEVLEFLGRALVTFSEVHIGHTQDEVRLHAPQTDRYTNRLPEFTSDVARSTRRQIFFAATKGGSEKVERLLKEFG